MNPWKLFKLRAKSWRNFCRNLCTIFEKKWLKNQKKILIKFLMDLPKKFLENFLFKFVNKISKQCMPKLNKIFCQFFGEIYGKI